MSEFNVVRRKHRNRRDKIEKPLIDKIAVIKNDLKLTDFYEKAMHAVHNCLQLKLHIFNDAQNNDTLDCNMLRENTVAFKSSHEHAEKLEKAVNEIHVANSDKSKVKGFLGRTDFENWQKEENNDPEPDHTHTAKNDVTETVEEVICYGLGNFSDSHIARYQLAFLLLTLEEMDIPICKCHIFDPKFNNEEKTSLQKLGFNLIGKNEVGKRRCNKKTLFYMPHCGKALYNNLLWANWGLGLKNLMIIGNSFSRIVDNTPERILIKTVPYILKVQPYETEVELPVTEKFEDVFSDTVIHTFCDLETKVQDEFWDDGLEPQYENDDPEIIFS